MRQVEIKSSKAHWTRGSLQPFDAISSKALILTLAYMSQITVLLWIHQSWGGGQEEGHALRGTEWYKADSEHHVHITTTDMWSDTQMCWIHCTILTLLSPACSYVPSNRGTQSGIQRLRKRTGCSWYQFRYGLFPSLWKSDSYHTIILNIK